MRITIIAASVLLLLSACRGEKVPRDFQNAPPAMRHPPTSSAQTPTANGMRGATPEPSKGAEGANITKQPASGTAPNVKLGNQAPTTTTHT
ncbi:MAG: hypothetical protein JO093_23665 [Acidobacteria bacterium]|nr:hypothetical protein [Acidobacteriota bacterium]MBV9188626.1 hypothetical protein [Acidobacteriota bacterium]